MPHTEQEIPNIAIHMIRRDLENLPEFGLPPGFRIRWYQPGDRDTWVRIHLAAERYVTITPELFDREFGPDEAELARRQAYLCDEGGRAIGTATAWFDPAYHGQPFGRVHWVAIVPEMQGRGLSKPLLSAVCQRLKALGHERAYLVTSTARIPAIKLYLRFGFVPEIRVDEDVRAWRIVAGHIDHPALRPFREG
ncbi:MAG: GNAT family N-acetyltransferase [Anaerolineae bacterium]